jgi:nucleoid DNA-binding protein
VSDDLLFRDVVVAVSKRTCQPRIRVERAVREAFREMQSALASGREVSIHNFGRFSLRTLAEREGYDFGSGERMRVAGRTKVRFVPFKRTERAIRASKVRVR